ncbi:MAG: hypothetical protein H0T76_18645 [Nannocystis sp.]|nr:hypothetical protein [Nannocystis sp.]MBA3548506.1 hypothetical protein [Nannocystis sp.]
MSNALLIDGRDFERWADRPEARSELPILVRRLLWASTRLQELNMPGGSGVDRPGYDGFCRSEEGSAFCPAGDSVWELSVKQRVTDKIAADLAKRGETLPRQGERLSFVFVTPRRLPAKAIERHGPPDPWRSVRIIDADGLAQWIEQCPAVAAWFSRRHLQRPVDDLTTLDVYLARWSAATRPPLPPRIVLLGRASQAAQVHKWLAERPGTLTVQATTKDEARIFVAAALEELPVALQEKWIARTIIVETPTAWRWLLQASTMPLLLLPGFDDFDPRFAHGPHYVGLPGDGENPLPAWSQVTLDEPPPWRDVEKILRDAGLEPWRAEQIARETRGHLRPLQRALGLRELPHWAERKEHGELVAMLLLGAWRPDVEADTAAVRALGADPLAVDRLCTRLRTATEAPIRSQEGVYTWAAPDDAWRSLVSLVSEAVLRSFRALALDVLGEDDPSERLPADERPVAALWGAGFRHSNPLRHGVAESLRYLTRHNDELRKSAGASVGRNLAERVVEQVLTTSWMRWTALEPHLQNLAEAAPNRFLARLSESLNDPEGVVRLFDMETESSSYRRRPHVALLWALEALAWDPSHMPMVAELLAVLADRDPARREPRQHGRVSNRPQASLEAIFHISQPQTLANEEARFAVLKTLAGSLPDVAFALLLRLFKQRGGGILPQSRRPSDGESLTVSERQIVSLAQINAWCHRVLELLLELADHDATRWATIIAENIERLMDESHAEGFADRLIARRDSLGDSDVVVWRAAKSQLGRLCSIHHSVRPEKHIARLRRVYEAYTPNDLLTRLSWMFEWAEVLPEPHTTTIEDKTRRLDSMRVAAVEEILAHDDAERLMVQLITELEDLDKLGRALSRCSAAASLQERLLQQHPPEAWRPVVAPFASGCFYTAKQDFVWLRALARRWHGEQRLGDIIGTFHKIWAEPRVWDIVDELGEPIRTSYWADLKLVGEHNENQWERACTLLLGAGNVSTAFALAAYRCEDLATATLVEVLERFFADPIATTGDTTYGTEKIFLEFDRRDEQGIDEEIRNRIVAMEFRLIKLLEHGYQRRPRFVWQFLSNSPAFFVDCLRAIYHGDNGVREDIDEARSRIAANADSILCAWHDFPGSDSDDPRVWEPKLLAWAERVFALAREHHRFVPAQFRVAEVLARPLAGEDGHWPCLAARELVQRGELHELSRAMQTAKYNLRGTTTHGLHEGGAQERVLASQFQAGAEALRTRWPRAGMLLDELARTYEMEGDRQDQWARARRIEAGIGPDDLLKRPTDSAADERCENSSNTSAQPTGMKVGVKRVAEKEAANAGAKKAVKKAGAKKAVKKAGTKKIVAKKVGAKKVGAKKAGAKKAGAKKQRGGSCSGDSV